MMARTANSFKRDFPKKYKQQPRVLILCEDSKSGKKYLEDAASYFRVNLEVEVAHCGHTDPKGIVTVALLRTRHYDRVFCAIDRDAHQNFDEAIQIAGGDPKVELVISYPCFEFWLLLHFGHSRKPYARAGKNSPGDLVCRDLRKRSEMTGYNKGNSADLFRVLLDKLPAARITSRRVLQEALNDQAMNPSTRIHCLIDYIEGMADLKV